MTLLVVFAHKHLEDQGTVLQQQLLHSCAVIEKFFDDSQYFISVLEMSCKPINVDEYVN